MRERHLQDVSRVQGVAWVGARTLQKPERGCVCGGGWGGAAHAGPHSARHALVAHRAPPSSPPNTTNQRRRGADFYSPVDLGSAACFTVSADTLFFPDTFTSPCLSGRASDRAYTWSPTFTGTANVGICDASAASLRWYPQLYVVDAYGYQIACSTRTSALPGCAVGGRILTFEVSKNTLYYIVVDGRGSGSGIFSSGYFTLTQPVRGGRGRGGGRGGDEGGS